MQASTKTTQRRPQQLLLLLVGAVLVIAALVVLLNRPPEPPLYDWWLVGAGVKLEPNTEKTAQNLTLHAARGEFAPFQIVLRGGSQNSASVPISVEAPSDHLDVTLFQQQYLVLTHQDPDPLYARARLNAPRLPDGLRPLESPVELATNDFAAIWVDVYVDPETPPGTYPITLNLGGTITQAVTLIVYPVDMSPDSALSVIIPIEPNWTMPFYAPDDPDTLQHQVNTLMLAHRLVPGSFVSQPRVNGQTWDFSPLADELAQLPPHTRFYAPSPYDAAANIYRLVDENGEPFTTADFDNPAFVSAAANYFTALADFLRAQGRLDDALVYPVDETRWVGDEPIHNGAAGFERLAQWAHLAHDAGLRVIGSEVLPVAPGSSDLGWMDTTDMIDVSHVEVDLLDGAPEMFARWQTKPNKQTAIYLNGYGDDITLSAAIPRGLAWYAYARGVPIIAGYAAMQWVNESFDLVDPWTQADQLFPQAGYGGGALVWPGPLPSLRLKLLREGVEDIQLLDLYAQQTNSAAARQIAACLTAGRMADQNPNAAQWDDLHTALLQAISGQTPIDLHGRCPLPLLDFDQWGDKIGDWNFVDATGEMVESPWRTGSALQVMFTGASDEAGFWFGQQNWSGWSALRFDAQNDSAFVSVFNIGLTAQDGQFMQLRHQGLALGPGERQTFQLMLPTTDFDLTQITYLSIQVNTTISKRDGTGENQTYPLGERQLTFDNFVLVP